MSSIPISPDIKINLNFGDPICCPTKGEETPIYDQELVPIVQRAAEARLVVDSDGEMKNCSTLVSILYGTWPFTQNQSSLRRYHEGLIQLAMQRSYCEKDDSEAGSQIIAIIAAAQGVDFYTRYLLGYSLKVTHISRMGKGFRFVEPIKGRLFQEIEKVRRGDFSLASKKAAKVTKEQLIQIRTGLLTLPQSISDVTLDTQPESINQASARAFLLSLGAQY